MVSSLDINSAKFLDLNPKRPCAGIATENDVYLYSIVNNSVYPKGSTGLTNPLQKRITCLRWNPFGNTLLAVGCENGIFLWRLVYDPNVYIEPVNNIMPIFSDDRNSQPTSNSDHLLTGSPRHDRISCISWSPCGRWLISGSSELPGLVLWDTFSWDHLVLANGVSGSSLQLEFSSCSSWLIQSMDKGITIWETSSWDNTKLATRTPPSGISWIPQTKIILFSLERSSKIYMLQMKALNSLETINAPSFELPSLDGPKGTTMNDTITSIKVDQSGKYLMATFHEKGVILYRIKMNPLPTFEPMRWVNQGSSNQIVSFGFEADNNLIGVLENGSFTSQLIN